VLIAFLGLITNLQAQVLMDEFAINGKVTEGMMKLKGVKITIYTGGEVYDFHYSNDGLFYLELPLGKDYQIQFYKRNYVSKKVDVMLKGVDDLVARADQKHETWTIDLFPKVHGVDYSPIENQPFGKVYFDFGQRLFKWDAEYAKGVEKELKKLKKEEKHQVKEIEHVEKVLEKAKEFVEKHEDQMEVAVESYPPKVEEITSDENVSDQELKDIEKGLAQITYQLEKDIAETSVIPIDEIFDMFNPIKIVVEHEEDARKIIEIRKVTRGDQIDEYWKVKHRWGGEFFFKNNQPSSHHVWQIEARGN
jgi:hypothetical protein